MFFYCYLVQSKQRLFKISVYKKSYNLFFFISGIYKNTLFNLYESLIFNDVLVIR